jgi:rRNA processing protein Krr1/Pno1
MSDSVTAYMDNQENMNQREVKITIDKEKSNSNVIHPKHYGGKDNPYEAIKVIEAWGVGFNLGNTLKYISRAGKKDSTIQDLEKALFYLDREIQNLKKIG